MDGMLVRLLYHFLERLLHDLAQPVVDLLERPWERLKRLHPFEIGDGDTPRIREDVRQEHHALVVENAIRFRSRRPVGCFRYDSGRYPVCVPGGNLPLQRGGDQHVALKLEQLLIRDIIRFQVPDDAAGTILVLRHLVEVQPIGVVDAAS